MNALPVEFTVMDVTASIATIKKRMRLIGKKQLKQFWRENQMPFMGYANDSMILSGFLLLLNSAS